MVSILRSFTCVTARFRVQEQGKDGHDVQQLRCTYPEHHAGGKYQSPRDDLYDDVDP